MFVKVCWIVWRVYVIITIIILPFWMVGTFAGGMKSAAQHPFPDLPTRLCVKPPHHLPPAGLIFTLKYRRASFLYQGFRVPSLILKMKTRPSFKLFQMLWGPFPPENSDLKTTTSNCLFIIRSKSNKESNWKCIHPEESLWIWTVESGFVFFFTSLIQRQKQDQAGFNLWSCLVIHLGAVTLIMSKSTLGTGRMFSWVLREKPLIGRKGSDKSTRSSKRVRDTSSMSTRSVIWSKLPQMHWWWKNCCSR